MPAREQPSLPKVFLDTNVLLYLLSADASKADRAEWLLEQGGIISVQVLNEFASVATRKLGLSWAEATEILQTIQTCCTVQPLTLETHQRGLALAERYQLPLYDAMIAASALLAGCEVLYTEDFQDGQKIEGKLKVENPFNKSSS